MRSHHLFCFLIFASLLSCQQVQDQAFFGLSSNSSSGQGKGKTRTETANIIFQSADGGQSWQDISAGLPMELKPWNFYANKGELMLTTESGLYKSSAASKDLRWGKDISMGQQLINVAPNPAGMMAVSNNAQFFQKLEGTDVWMPIFTGFKNASVRNIFTALDGSIFIASDDGLFKSADGGKSWKNVMNMGWVLEMAESNGVLLCTNEGGILRSADGGETWEVVLSEGGVGIDLTTIKGGFAAIDYSHGDEIRHIQISTDAGKTWKRIDAGLPPSKLISSIVQMGEYLYCGHPEGIYRTANQGETWELILPTIGEKVFNLTISNGVMYALLRDGGC